MNKEKYIEDLQEIRTLMDRSTKFISLSGWAGVFAGLVALISASCAYYLLGSSGVTISNYTEIGERSFELKLLGLGLITLFVAIVGGIYFTMQKSKKQQKPVWDKQTKRVVTDLSIPLITGGILSVLLLLRGSLGIIAPLTLVFYGMALLNVSHYTRKEVKQLAITEIVLGLLAAVMVGYGLVFWAIGFGVAHIIYGVKMELNAKS